MNYDEQKESILKIFKDKGICENGIAQLNFSEQVDALIDYFKANYIFSLKEGLISLEILETLDLVEKFAARGCYFGKRGNISVSESAIFVDCNLEKVSATGKKLDFMFFKNCNIETINLISSSAEIFRLYDKVTVKKINLIGSCQIAKLRLNGSSVKFLSIDNGSKVLTCSRATKTIGEVINPAGIIKTIVL